MFALQMNKGSSVTTTQPPPASAAGVTSVSRTLLVRIEGDRMTWDSQGANGAMWRMTPEHASTIFHYAPNKGEMPSSSAMQQERLSRAMIKRVTVMETFSNINEAVAMQIDNLPCKEFTEAGDGAHLFLCCGGHCQTPKEVYNIRGDTELGMAWMQKYPRHTVHNLDTQGVVRLPGKTFCFVEEKHPVLAYMKLILPGDQYEMLVDMDMGPMQGQGFYRINNDDFNFYATDIREHVLRDAPASFDLSTLTVRIRRPNGAKWFSVSENEAYNLVDSTQTDKVDQNMELLVRYMEKTLQLTMRLEVEYTLPDLMETSD